MKRLTYLALCAMMVSLAGTEINCQDDNYKYTRPATELRTVEEYKEVVGNDADYKLIKEAIKDANADCQKALETCPQ